MNSPYKWTGGNAVKVESHRARNIHTADAVNSRRKEKKMEEKELKAMILNAMNDDCAKQIQTTFDRALPVTAITTPEQAEWFYKTALAFGDKAEYKACRILYRVRNERLFMKGQPPCKSFNEWAVKSGISKSKANAQAKIGEWIDENGDKDIFAEKRGGLVFNVSALIVLFEKTNGDKQKVFDLIEKKPHIFNHPMTVDDIKTVFKLNPAKEVNAEEENATDKPSKEENATEENATDKPEKDDKKPAVKITFTREEAQALLQYLTATEKQVPAPMVYQTLIDLLTKIK